MLNTLKKVGASLYRFNHDLGESGLFGFIGDAIGGIAKGIGKGLGFVKGVADKVAPIASFIPGPWQPIAAGYSGISGGLGALGGGGGGGNSWIDAALGGLGAMKAGKERGQAQQILQQAMERQQQDWENRGQFRDMFTSMLGQPVQKPNYTSAFASSNPFYRAPTAVAAAEPPVSQPTKTVNAKPYKPPSVAPRTPASPGMDKWLGSPMQQDLTSGYDPYGTFENRFPMRLF